MLEDGIDDATDTERGLDDTGGDVLTRDLHVRLHELQEGGFEGVLLAVEVNRGLAGCA